MLPEEIIKPEVCIATSVCPHPELWHCIDDMATELEVLDFLRALVIMLKPKIVIETGCYHGHGTEQLLRGIKENRFGELYTCDLSWEPVLKTSERILEKLGEQDYTLVQCSGLDLIAQVPAPIDLAFLDSGPDEVRTNELRAVVNKLAPGGVVAIHDTGIHGFLREKYLGSAVAEMDLQAICFDTPRGLTLVRKRPTIYPI